MQFDSAVRVVSVENLKAMCDQVSSVSHKYWVEPPTKAGQFVRLTYSNPDEHAHWHRMTAWLPRFFHGKAELVVLMVVNVVHDNWEGEGWQAFETVLSYPALYRDRQGVWKINGSLPLSEVPHV